MVSASVSLTTLRALQAALPNTMVSPPVASRLGLTRSLLVPSRLMGMMWSRLMTTSLSPTHILKFFQDEGGSFSRLLMPTYFS